MGNRKPMLILGWMGSRPIGEETLQKAMDVIRELQMDIDTQEGFVPRLRRGYTILSFQPRTGEISEEARHRVQRAVQRVRTANMDLGRRGDGTQSRLWLTISQSPIK